MSGLGVVGKHKCATREGEAVSFEVLMEHQETVASLLLVALNQEAKGSVLNRLEGKVVVTNQQVVKLVVLNQQ